MAKNAFRIYATLWILLASCIAQTPTQMPRSLAANYIRTDFTVEEGLPDNVVNAITQTGNGLLWVGTGAGLATFDGRKFNPVHFKIPGAPPQGAVQSLVVAQNGDLWVGSNAGVVLIPAKSLDDPNPEAEFFSLGAGNSDEVEVLFQTRNGVLWVGTAHGLYRKDGRKFVNVLNGMYVSRIDEASNGNLLIVTGQAFFEFDGTRVIEHPELLRKLSLHAGEIFGVHQDRAGTIWYTTKLGVRRQQGDRIETLRPRAPATTAAERAFEDAQGNIWVCTGIGVFLVIGDELESPERGLYARSFFVSKDGSLWLGTNGNGLVNFRPRVVRMFSRKDGLLSDIEMAVLAGHDGRIWVGSNCGLNVYDGKKFKNYSEKDGLLNSCVWSLAEDSHQNLWIGTYGGGIFKFKDGYFTQYSVERGLVSKIVTYIQVAHDDSLWLATPDGLSHFKDGHFRNYTTADGLASNRVLAVHEDIAHNIWVESQAGIDRFVGDSFVHFASASTSSDRLASRFAEDSSGRLYTMNSTAGFSVIEGDHLVTLSEDMNLIDMVETSDHHFWFSSRNGIFRFDRDDFNDRDQRSPRSFSAIGRADGLASIQCGVGFPSIAIAPDEKLWVATVKGLAMIDLKKWPGPSRKPRVFLQGVTIEGRPIPVADSLVLPRGSHRVEFHLGAVDLISPEKIRLQYRMDGVDANWNNGDESRTAVYTNIPPGSHTLLVRATDSNGKWDQVGRSYTVTQQPYVYQTRAFQVLFLCALALLLWVAYFARVRQLVNHTRTLLEERLLERERIARDLHDTFFQGIQGLLLRFNTGTTQLPLNEPARQIFVEALEQSDRVMLEGRELVLDLHADETAGSDLPDALARAADEFSKNGISEYKVVVVGQLRRLHPVCTTDLFRIGKEALFNAFRHSGAHAVEVEVLYEKTALKLRIRDDGRGIDDHILREGRRPGHLGLPGMSERARRMGANFNIWSKTDSGTEIEITVPAEVAYALNGKKPATSGLSRWIRIICGLN